MEIKGAIEMVSRFMTACDQEVKLKPSNVDDKVSSLRYNLMSEENKEYFIACLQDNKVEILDAMIDMAYVLFGTVAAHGMTEEFIKGFTLVHENNMTKVQSDGKVLKNPDGKILKPIGYTSVNLKSLI
jgi:predicted HAD superfamily Cof-like phosphohydrolase